MGTVFVFLTLLVGATTLMSRIVLKLIPPASASAPAPEEIAAITAALVRHRRGR